MSAKEHRQLMRDRYVLLKRRKDLNDFDDQVKLQVWTDVYPLLGQAYELKEQFRDICSKVKPIIFIKIGLQACLKS